MSHYSGWYIPLVAIGCAFAVSALIIQMAGYDAVTALGALFNGALGNGYGLSETLLRSCPLLITGLAVSIAFRCGVWNIGAEGQFLMGVLLAAWMAPHCAAWPGYIGLPFLLMLGAAGGILWGGLAGYMKMEWHVQEVISTIMLNFVAIQLVSYAVHGPLMEIAGQFPQTDQITASARLTRWLPPTRLHTGVALAFVSAGILYFLLFRTVFGYQIRAVGLNAIAARAAGINVPATVIKTMCISGGLAGIAGAIELTGVTYRLYEDFASGYGYTAIAVALLGRLHPGGIVLAALLFGILETGAGSMQRTAQVSAVLVYVIQALILLFVVAAAVYDAKRKK